MRSMAMSIMGNPMNHNIILDNVTLGYERHPAVHHLDGIIYQGDMLAIVGPNGSGKSTLLKGLMKIIKPIEGKITSHWRSSDIAYLPQIDDLDRDFPISVQDFVSSGLMMRQSAWCCYKCDKQNVQNAINSVGLNGFEKRLINTLSGGQWQRARFARIITQNASMILLDEPFNALDESTVLDLIKILQNWNSNHKTIVTILHDYNLVRTYFPKSLLLARQLIAWGDTKEVLTQQNINQTNSLAEAFKENAPLCDHKHETHTHAH